MAYAFGAPFEAFFDPQTSDRRATGAIPTSDAATGTPKIYVFRDFPSTEQILAGTGALATVTSWTPDGEGFKFTVPAIDDPDPNSEITHYTYYLGICFVLRAGGDVQPVRRSLPMERVTGQTTRVGVTDEDLAQVFPTITSYGTEAQRIGFIRDAVGEIKDKLRGDGFEWCRIHNLQDLNRAVKLLALANIFHWQVQQQGDKHHIKYAEYKEKAKAALAALELAYDSDGDGVQDAEPKKVRRYAYVMS